MMKNVWTTALYALMGTVFLASTAQAGIGYPYFPGKPGGPPWAVLYCDGDFESDGDKSSTEFCRNGILYEASFKCIALDDGFEGDLAIWTATPFFSYWVIEGTDYLGAPITPVCAGEGWYGFGPTIKAEGGCKDAENGPNKTPGNGNNKHSQTPSDQVEYEIKEIGTCF